jgi:hypothetical protein
MEFRDYATTETSALLGRLLSSQAEGAAQQLRIVREALEAAARAAESAAAAAPRAAEQEVAALAVRLGAAAEAERQRVEEAGRAALDNLRAELSAHQSETQKLAAALAEATERADAADRDLDATIDAHKQVDAARIEAEAGQRREAQARASLETEVRDLRGMLESTRTEAARMSDQLESEAAQNAVLSAERESAGAECVALTAQLAAATAQFEAMSARFEAATARYEAAVAQLEDVGAELDVSRASVAALEEAQAERQGQLAQLERRLAESVAAEVGIREQAAQLERQLAERAGTESGIRDQVAQLERRLAESLGAEAGVRDQLDQLAGRLAESVAAEAASRDQATQLERRLADSLGLEARIRDQAEGAGAELDRAQGEIAALGGQTARLTTLLEGSVQAVDTLGRASNVSELLAALVKQLSTAFPRVALFRVKDNHVEGEHQIGFDMTADVSKLMIPLNVESLITRVASSGVQSQLTGAELAGSNHAPFGGTPDTVLALPIIFQEETLAVVYLESDHGAAEQARSAHHAGVSFATLLVRHTAVLLTRLSQELKMLAELREYATMLLQEADQMYAADVESGKSEADRRRRLQETIDCARQLYAQRAALEGAAAAGLLDEQIALQSANSSPFARELAAVAGHDQPQSRRNAS